MKLRLPAAFALLSLALVMALVPNANGATTTIGSLPTNATPSPGYYLIVDDGVSNTWKSTINAVLGSSLGIPVTTINGGTGLSSPAPSATGCGTISGTWPNNVFDTTACSGVTSISAGSNITVTSGATPVVAVASPTASACPSAIAGWSSTFVLQYMTGGCAHIIQAQTSANLVVTNGTGPSPAIGLASPAATAAASSCAGNTAGFIMVYTPGSCAIVGQSFIGNEITVGLPNVAPSVGGFSRAYQIPPNSVGMLLRGSHAFCDGAGSGGSALSWQWFETSGALVYSTANPISTTYAFAANNLVSGGATNSPTAFPTATGAGVSTWIYAEFPSVPSTAPSPNCSIFFEFSQTIQLGP